MSFSQILKEVAQDVKGAKGAVVVGMDGIIVDEYTAEPGMDLQSISAEYGNILKEVQIASLSLQMGRTNEVSIITDSNDLIMRKINEDYFLALILSPDGNFGKGRFVVRRAVNLLAKEF